MKWFKEIMSAYKYKKRIDEIQEQCGCVLFCPHCREPLNDSDRYLSVDKFTSKYVCKDCGTGSIWEFGIAPVPILTETLRVKGYNHANPSKRSIEAKKRNYLP